METLLLRASVVCSNEHLHNKEIKHLRNVFHHSNDSSKSVTQNVISKVKEEQSALSVIPSHVRRKKGKKTLRKITKEVNKILPDKHKATLVYTGTKLGSTFNIKDITKKENKHDLVHSVKCPEETFNQTYNRETGRRLIEKINEHEGKVPTLSLFESCPCIS